MEQEYAERSTKVADVRTWVDGEGGEFGSHLAEVGKSLKGELLGIEKYSITRRVFEQLLETSSARDIRDAADLILSMRMIKDERERRLMRAAGRVAVVMGEAAIAALTDGVREYELALAALDAGTRVSAQLFTDDGSDDPYSSPVISNLMIISSGSDITMPHKRPTMRQIRKGDSVYLCFCTTAGFKGYHITYDRQVTLGEPTDQQIRLHDRVLAAQAAALAALRPGVAAQDVHSAARKVIEESGYRVDYRSGRGIGLSFLEPPEFKDGDTTLLRPGMAFAVDGGALDPGHYASRVGDSVLLTDSGFECLTDSPRGIRAVDT
jgi:Xaa-Pro aminopeptidase